ncbi:MAG: NUDIX hydrolase [Streptococcus suis]
MSNAIFGEKKNGVHYTNRYGVYAVIPDEKLEKIVLVQAPNGAWFLPGGEIEEGENHLSALERELIEELGFTAKIGQYFGQADEYFYSSHRDTHFYNPAYIYQVTSYKQVGAPLEDFNHIAWFPIEEAINKLKRGSHKWGIEQWKMLELAQKRLDK